MHASKVYLQQLRLPCVHRLKSLCLHPQGEQAWQKCKEGRNWSLLLEVLVFSYFWYIMGSVLLHLVSTAAGFAFPILLEYITNYLELCGAESVRWSLAPVSAAHCS